MCGNIGDSDIDTEVVLMGWVAVRRDLGGAIFFDLRDREGVAQIVFDAALSPDVHANADRCRNEWVIGIRGKVRSRGENANPNLRTGTVEVLASEIEVFSESKTPPFAVDGSDGTAEEKRLVHRYVDLRRPEIQENLILRSKIAQVARRTLVEHGCLEIETPYLVKYTPGGARNFVVPTRNAGKYYALAESPQLFKQLFMVGGLDRYFQISRCFRDEDLRGDRQPEFTQIDVELSFANEQTVQQVAESLMRNVWKECLAVELPPTFPKMTYDEAMSRYSSDKPDVRFGLEHHVLTDVVKAQPNHGLPLFESVLEQGGIIKAMVIPAQHSLSRKDLDLLESEVKSVGGHGLGRAKVGAEGEWTQSPFAKSISDDLRVAINRECGAKAGDLILFQLGQSKIVHTCLNHLRLHLGRKLDLIPDNTWEILWVTDFPLFEYDEGADAYGAAHHPFTSPRQSDLDKLASNPGDCYARAYDLVLNGNEVGGGSVRIHRSDVQSKVFSALGVSDAEQREKFGFLLDALQYGAPPHAGIALGLDRLVMLACGAMSLREVLAFPKTQTGTDLMSGAPAGVSDGQLAEVHVKPIVG